ALSPRSLHDALPIYPRTAIWTILVVMVWHSTGLAMVLYLAGLQGISDDVYEATLVDGASNWLRFCRILLPLLAPAITVAATVTRSEEHTSELQSPYD